MTVVHIILLWTCCMTCFPMVLRITPAWRWWIDRKEWLMRTATILRYTNTAAVSLLFKQFRYACFSSFFLSFSSQISFGREGRKRREPKTKKRTWPLLVVTLCNLYFVAIPSLFFIKCHIRPFLTGFGTAFTEIIIRPVREAPSPVLAIMALATDYWPPPPPHFHIFTQKMKKHINTRLKQSGSIGR